MIVHAPFRSLLDSGGEEGLRQAPGGLGDRAQSLSQGRVSLLKAQAQGIFLLQGWGGRGVLGQLWCILTDTATPKADASMFCDVIYTVPHEHFISLKN